MKKLESVVTTFFSLILYLNCLRFLSAAVIMTPTRELALQIHREAKKFCKPFGLRVTCVYGGTGISEQVTDDFSNN